MEQLWIEYSKVTDLDYDGRKKHLECMSVLQTISANTRIMNT